MDVPAEEAEQLKSLSMHIRESPAFLAFRNLLRHQLVKVAESANASATSVSSSSAASTSSSDSSAPTSSLLQALRQVVGAPGAAGTPTPTSSNGVDALTASAIEFTIRSLTNSKSATSLPMSAEQRTALASRLTRDAVLWTARALDAQFRVRRTFESRNAQLDAVQQLVNNAQREWKALINVRLESLKILSQYPLMRSAGQSTSGSTGASGSTNGGGGGGGGGGDSASEASPRAQASGAAPALSADELLSILVERTNAGAITASKRRHASAPDGSSSAIAVNDDPPGIDNLGFFTIFVNGVHKAAKAANLVPSLTDLRVAFAELDPMHGPSRNTFTHASCYSKAVSESFFLHLLDTGDRPESITSHTMRGVPPSIRRLVYAKCLNIPLLLPTSALHASSTCDTRRVRFATANAAKILTESAQSGRNQQQTADISSAARQLLRQMTAADVASRIGDSDKYFVFVDECTAVATAMLEDRNIGDHHLKKTVEQRGEDVQSYLSSTVLGGCRTPLCGVMPFAGSSVVVGPLAFVTGDLFELYELAAAMQGQIWAPLQSCTTDLLTMALLFERLVTHFAPAAVLHCMSKLSVSPLTLTIKWMVTGFGELLEPGEALALYDLLVAVHCRAYFGLSKAQPGWVLAMVAAAIFTFRGALIQQCFSPLQAAKVLEDGVKLQPIPLLQQMLFLL